MGNPNSKVCVAIDPATSHYPGKIVRSMSIEINGQGFFDAFRFDVKADPQYKFPASAASSQRSLVVRFAIGCASMQVTRQDVPHFGWKVVSISWLGSRSVTGVTGGETGSVYAPRFDPTLPASMTKITELDLRVNPTLAVCVDKQEPFNYSQSSGETIIKFQRHSIEDLRIANPSDVFLTEEERRRVDQEWNQNRAFRYALENPYTTDALVAVVALMTGLLALWIRGD